MANIPTYENLKKRVNELEKEVIEHKNIEGSLSKNAEKYRHILEIIEEGYFELDLKGNVTFFNDILMKFHQRSHVELMGLNYREFTSEKDMKKLYNVFSEIFQSGIPAVLSDCELIKKDGSIGIVELTVSLLRNPSNDPIGFWGVLRDVTVEKKTEKALRESEEKYRQILEKMEEGYYEVDLAGKFTFGNKALCHVHGYPRDELMGMNNREYSSPEEAKKIYRIFNEVYRTGIPSKVVAYELIGKDGSVRLAEISASLLRNDLGEPIGFYGITRDRTEQEKSESALRESEEKYRLVVENANEGIYIIQDGMMKFPNPRTNALTGYSTEELASMPFLDLIHPEDRDFFIQQLKQSPKRERSLNVYSFKMINKADETVWVDLNTIPIIWEGHPATLNFLRDITPQKKMEIQLLQAGKMEALGTLAGGIAHNFNNILMGIQGNTSLIQLDIENDHPHYVKLKNITQLVKDGSGLAKQLLGMARGGKYEAKPADLNKLVERSANLFGRTKKEITIQTEFKKDIWPVEVDSGQIDQVFLNLFVNAWHAMPGGGDLYIKTQNVTLDEDYSRSYHVDPGMFVKISITDTGIGMDERIVKRIFDPFFTTKDMTSGTGLGLASAYGVIQNHKGFITVYSEKGHGTTFNIYLPASKKKILEEANTQDEILPGTGTILFVDDEEGIRQIGEDVLKRFGYQVITAKSGEKAIEIFQKDRGEIDLVILDMIMPEMSGGETFDKLKEINPSVKVLLSSGYTINGQAKTILDRGCKGFIQKPFSLGDLSKRVKQILLEDK